MEFHFEIVLLHSVEMVFQSEIALLHSAEMEFQSEIVHLHSAEMEFQSEIWLSHSVEIEFHFEIALLHSVKIEFQHNTQAFSTGKSSACPRNALLPERKSPSRHRRPSFGCPKGRPAPRIACRSAEKGARYFFLSS